MPSNDLIINKLIVTLTSIIVLSLCLTISSCKESTDVSSNKDVFAPEAPSSHPNNVDREKSTVNKKAQDRNLTNEQFQNNPPTASRPRFPTPKPTPAPGPAPVQGSEGGSQ